MIQIDRRSHMPPYQQIITNITQLIILEKLRPGEKLPSVRALALEVSVNPNTIQKAYSKLNEAGIIHRETGAGSFVASDAVNICKQRALSEIRGWLHCLVLAGVDKNEILEFIEQT